MPFAYYQRASVESTDTKDKKKAKHQGLEFSDDRDISRSIDALQLKVNNSPNNQSLIQLQENIDNKTGMPDDLKQGVENLSGEDMSDVNVNYNSEKPAQLKAHAYAAGNDIHVGPGQEKHLAHEAWHVVQQKQNRVKPTTKADSGELINDDPALEKEADVMGQKALQLKSTEKPELNTSNNQNQIIQKIGDEEQPSSETTPKKDQKERTNPGDGFTIEKLKLFFKKVPSIKENIDNIIISSEEEDLKKDPKLESELEKILTKYKEFYSFNGEIDFEKFKEEYFKNFSIDIAQQKTNILNKEDEVTFNGKDFIKAFWQENGLRNIIDGHIASGFAKAIDISNKAKEELKKVNTDGQRPDKTIAEVVKLMTQLNSLKGKKGFLYSRSEKDGEVLYEQKEVTLGDFKDFNDLFIDPKLYVGKTDNENYERWFKKGAAKIDKFEEDAGMGESFDFGRTNMGERGSIFFGPMAKQEKNLKLANSDNGIYTLTKILALNEENTAKWLSTDHEIGINSKNPDDKVKLIKINGDLFGKELQEIFNGKMPRGNENSAYPNEWLASGYAQSNENMTKQKELFDQMKKEVAQKKVSRAWLKKTGKVFKEKVVNSEFTKIASKIDKVAEIAISPFSIDRYMKLKITHEGLITEEDITMKNSSRRGNKNDKGKYVRKELAD